MLLETRIFSAKMLGVNELSYRYFRKRLNYIQVSIYSQIYIV